MRLLVGSEIKQAAIGQSLTKPIKLKSVIPPLLFDLGVIMDRIVGSKTLIIELAKLGFSVSYDDYAITRFKQSVAIQSQSEDEESVSSVFSQWVADNCDHNANTLDGKRVFRLMRDY